MNYLVGHTVHTYSVTDYSDTCYSDTLLTVAVLVIPMLPESVTVSKYLLRVTLFPCPEQGGVDSLPI